MRISLVYLFVPCLILLLGIENAVAQQGAKKEAELKFSCLYWEGLPAEDLYYREKKTYRQIEFKQSSRSKSFSLKGTQVFELYRKVPEPVEGKPPYQLLTKAQLPDAKQVLFVVIPYEDKQSQKYRVYAMDDSITAFPRGAFRFANFCPQTLLVKCGETVRKIPPNQLSVVKPRGKPKGGFVPFVIGNAKGKTIFGTRVFGQPSGRELIFISPPEKPGGRPRVKFISQLLAPPTPEKVP